MQCPKCHTKLDDNQTICPNCNKVLQLECPNCHTLGEDAICQNCGYTILIKCSKCGKKVTTTKKNCKCGFSIQTSIALQECESDDIASIIIEFKSLKAIKKELKSQELYSKFFFKLKNLLYLQLKDVDCKFITYNNSFVVNINKELSFSTSSHKAIRLALKIMNAFVNLNSNTIDELAIPLNLNLKIIKKRSEQLLEFSTYESNVKPLNIKKDSKKYLKGLQIVLDQHVRDEINKEYKTDSLYSLEENGNTMMFYELILDSYVLPPTKKEIEPSIQAVQHNINKDSDENEKSDTSSFKMLDINAKCSFEQTCAVDFFEKISNIDLQEKGKLIAIRTKPELGICTADLVNFYEKSNFKVLTVSCTEELTYKPWGALDCLFKDYFNLSFHNNFIDLSKINEIHLKTFGPLFNLTQGLPTKAMTPEDARYAFMEQWIKFLSILNNTVIIIEGFENLDDTTIQTLELYFDKFKTIKPNFVFITSNEVAVHSKIKGLLRTHLYTEYTLNKSSMNNCLATLSSDATDFIQSFYFEKIKENFNGSLLYFQNAINYLKTTGVLIDFNNKLLIKTKKSIILPASLEDLLKAIMKHLSKNIDLSFILAYSSILGPRLDINILSALNIKDIEKNIDLLVEQRLARKRNEFIYINNFIQLLPIITNSLKKEAETFLVKNIIAQLGKNLNDTSMALILGKIGFFKEEYLTLWKNSQFGINAGDYDAYLKNSLGFLSLIEHIDLNITEENIEKNKKDVFNNILMYLYNYSPTKIYSIENILLMDAIEAEDDDKIVKLSNLMLQGALISSNYNDALGLLYNILSRMPQATLNIDGKINTKFLLLSLVNIEILYNIGDFRQCIEIGNDILAVISVENIETVKPKNFSTNFFITHLIEIFRLVAFAKLFVLDNDLEDFFEKLKNILQLEFPDRDCILAIKDFLAGKIYETGNIEDYPAFSKIIFLILQEFSILKDDYKKFAQNIYQAKLLAIDINQKEIELLCDLLIAYAYSKIGNTKKASDICNDVLKIAEKSAIFNIIAFARFLLANLAETSEKALLIVDDAFSQLQKYNNQAQILYAMFQKTYINIIKDMDTNKIDIESEEQKISTLKETLVTILN